MVLFSKNAEVMLKKSGPKINKPSQIFARPQICPALFCPASSTKSSGNFWSIRAGHLRTNKVVIILNTDYLVGVGRQSETTDWAVNFVEL